MLYAFLRCCTLISRYLSPLPLGLVLALFLITAEVMMHHMIPVYLVARRYTVLAYRCFNDNT